ncbi:uncharacterized protein LOC144163956 isoform X2 [Haemaphysalis longicornis]
MCRPSRRLRSGSGAAAPFVSLPSPTEWSQWPVDVSNAVPASNQPGSILRRRTGDAPLLACTFRWSRPRPSMYPASESSRHHQGPGASQVESLWDPVTLDSEELAHQAWGVSETSLEDGTADLVEQRRTGCFQAVFV